MCSPPRCAGASPKLLSAENPAVPRQRLTAVRAHEPLTQAGLMLSYSSVQQEVKRQRAVLNARIFVQLCCDPGDKMQLDFGEARLALPAITA